MISWKKNAAKQQKRGQFSIRHFLRKKTDFRELLISRHCSISIPIVLTLFLYPWFSDVFRGYRNGLLTWNGLKNIPGISQKSVSFSETVSFDLDIQPKSFWKSADFSLCWVLQIILKSFNNNFLESDDL